MNLIRQIQVLRAKAARCRNLRQWKQADCFERQARNLVINQLNAETVAGQMKSDLDCWQDWPSEAYGDS